MKTITSTQNPEIKHLVSLHSAKGRKAAGQCIGQGLRVCKTMIDSGLVLVACYVTEAKLTDVKSFIDHSFIRLVNDTIMKKISTTMEPSGIVCIFKQPDPPSVDALSSGIVLARLQNPGNVGTLIRTCAAMNQTSIVLIESVDPWNPKVVQASAGTIGLVNLFQWDWKRLVHNKNNLQLAALIVKGGASIASIKDTQNLLVVGSEAHGIPAEWVTQCDTSITLVMPGETESLNAAVAGSIALYLLATFS